MSKAAARKELCTIDAVLTWLLFRSRLFERAGLWRTAKEDSPDDAA